MLKRKVTRSSPHPSQELPIRENTKYDIPFITSRLVVQGACPRGLLRSPRTCITTFSSLPLRPAPTPTTHLHHHVAKASFTRPKPKHPRAPLDVAFRSRPSPILPEFRTSSAVRTGKNRFGWSIIVSGSGSSDR